MIAVIQSAEGRQSNAGHLIARSGERVLFVADPQQAPGQSGVCHARPDDVSSFGAPWRKLVLGYNANPRNNPLGLLPAHRFYPDAIYSRLVEELGPAQTYILSAGWGLVPASFLVPNYDITFRPAAEPYRRRDPSDRYADFCMLPEDGDEDLYLFAEADYLPLFCRLTASYPGRRIVFYRSENPPEAPGCDLRKFEAGNEANWHHACARAFLATRPKPRSESDEPGPKISTIEARLRALKKTSGASAALSDEGSGPDVGSVRIAIRHARHEIEEYLWLMRAFHEVDVTEDMDFQEHFNAFHRIGQRSKEWHTAYYGLLEEAKATGAEFAAVLNALWEDTGRYEPGFASRLVATVHPFEPVWDRFALMNAGLRAPAYLDHDKLRRAAAVYRQLGEWYRDRLEAPAGQRILELFDEEAPDHEDLNALKKLEFVMWHLRAGHHSPVVAGPAREAAYSRPA